MKLTELTLGVFLREIKNPVSDSGHRIILFFIDFLLKSTVWVFFTTARTFYTAIEEIYQSLSL